VAIIASTNFDRSLYGERKIRAIYSKYITSQPTAGFARCDSVA